MDSINNAKLKRNLLFCLLSALETDLRSNFLFLLKEKISISNDIKIKLKRRYYDNSNSDTDDLKLLIDYLDFGDYSQILNQNSDKFSNKKLSKLLSEDLSSIVRVRNRVMHTRPLEYDDDKKVLKFVNKIDKFKEIVTFSETKKEMDLIDSDPNHLIKIKLDNLKKNKSFIKHNLPMVDYDDTGFIGRIRDKEMLKNKLLGAYPVITLIGVGGIGKTSLVLSCLYDLIEDNETKLESDFFDTVIWISLKTKGMFDGEFEEIRNAITNLDDSFKSLKNTMKNINVKSIDDILEYMKNHKTLLVIDNLETLTTGDTNKLFDEIPNGSKILVTSRVSIGNYERSIKLEELNINDALIYFKRLCNIYKVDCLLKQSESKTKDYIKALKNNPLAIKWFVINVGKGITPEKILSNNFDDLTNFCLSNIYEKLSENAKHILRVILRKRNKCEQAEIVYISELDYISCAEGIKELFKSNFLLQNEDYTYSIPDFTVNYIQSQRDFSTREQDNKIQININKLNGSIENLNRDIHLTNEYHPLSLFPTTNSEKIATLYMLKVIESSKRQEYKKIDEYFNLAKDSAPQFADIYKIAGYLYSRFNTLNSEINYETAIRLALNKAPIYYFYSGFLMNTQNYERAELELRNALEIDKDNQLIKLRLARLYKMLNMYEKSLELLNSIDTNKKEFFENRMQIKYIFEMVDTRIRFSESLIDNNNKKALSLINSAIEFLENTDPNLFDFTIYNSMFRLLYVYIKLLSLSNYDIDDFFSYLFDYQKYILVVKKGHKKEEQFDYDLEKFKTKISTEDAKKIDDIFNYRGIIKQKNLGHVTKINVDRGFGFLIPMSCSYQSIFFHCSQFKGDFRKLELGDRVCFGLSVNHDRTCAINLELAKNTLDDEDNNEVKDLEFQL